jgi:hypothetical protein
MKIHLQNISISLFLLVLIFNLFSSCKDENGCPPGSNCKYSIKINNATSLPILTYYQLNFPDTLIQENKPNFSNASGNSYCYLDSDERWEEIIRKNEKNVITIFILDYDTIQKYLWSNIRVEYKILKRFELSSDSLKKLGWTLTFNK